MSALGHNESEIVAAASVTDAQHIFAATEKELGRGSIDVGKKPSFELRATDAHEDDGVTEEDLLTLRRVSGKIPWPAYTLAFVELCERFSYYGTTIVCT
jgi:proton-dependent oligopeptide transporter, POT family